MKRIKSKRVIAAILAILTTLCLSTGALAAEAVNPSGMMNNISFSGKAPSFQPSGEMGQMPELPNGEAPADAPELPEGEAPSFQPSGEMGQFPELPNGEAPADAPALPDGETPNVLPSGEMGQPGGAPAEQNNGSNFRGFIQQLINALQQLLGGARNERGLVQVSPAFEAATQNGDAPVRSDMNA